MKKSLSIISMSLLTAVLLIPSARAFADEERSEHRDLRQEQQLEQLRREREHEIREGDRRETRDYDQKIHQLERDMHQDRRSIGREREHERENEHEHEHEHD